MSRLRLSVIALAAVLAAAPGFAQGTTGSLAGIVTDQQGAAVPGAAVSAHNAATGLQRATTTDTTGSFAIHGLPVGGYELKVDLAGFAPLTRQGVAVNVGATTAVDLHLRLAGQSEEVTVVADAPLINAKESGVGEIVTSTQIENLPLNGRQFGNLAALVPGVGLGYHPDPTKSTQFAPQVAGGTGRNINYLIDGGDNNDDTVGGMVQNFPLDSVGQFNFVTQRFKAEYGRSYGGVLQVVTKSGTNDLQGSLFNYFRDRSLNAQTEQEKIQEVPKGDYRKYQFGGSLGGPIKKDKTHFFVSAERVQQDTTQAVDTLGLFPEKDGVFDLPFRETLAVGKLTHQLNDNHYLSVRYGYNTNSQPYGASPQSPPEHWGTSKNTFHSANLNLNTVLSGGHLNEFLFQYSYFHNHIGADSNLPTESFPNGVFIGQNGNTPQDTLQHKYQFRDDFTWTTGRHELKVGVMFINEPTLDVTFSTGQQPTFTHLDDALDSPITVITQNGPHRRVRRLQRRADPQQAVRGLHPGHLAGHGQAPLRHRPPLRPHHRLRVRSKPQPRLQRPAGGRTRGPAGRGSRDGGLRLRAAGGQEQLCPAPRLHLRPPRRRQPRGEGRRRPLLRLPVHQRHAAFPGHRLAVRLWRDLRGLELVGHSQRRRHRLPGRSAAAAERSRHRQRERRHLRLHSGAAPALHRPGEPGLLRLGRAAASRSRWTAC